MKTHFLLHYPFSERFLLTHVLKNHSNHWVIIPLYFVRLSFRVLPKWCHNIGSNVFTISVCHTNCFQNILNKSFFLKIARLIIQQNKFDAQELWHTNLFEHLPFILVAILFKSIKDWINILIISIKKYKVITIVNSDHFVWN